MSCGREDFGRWFDVRAADVRFFNAMELLTRIDNAVRGRANSMPTVELWDNILPTVRILDELRKQLAAPIILHSVYRASAYNRAVGGVSNSMHVHFNAIDFTCSKGKPRNWSGELKLMRSAGMFSGGIGTYRAFVHLDTRGIFGMRNATW
ncbi:hypothetical protein IIA79_01355 [bacterium]|nr:hypothetical protein [bacterium]